MSALEQIVEDNPGALWAIIGDILKGAAAEERGSRPGRRPAASVSSIEDLHAVIFPPAWSDKPLRQAIESLVHERKQSMRWFAMQVDLTRRTVDRRLERPDIEFIERAAKVLDVPPTWFPEYRVMTVGAAINNLLQKDYRYSVLAVRRLLGAR